MVPHPTPSTDILSNRVFHRFPDLPIELQLHIWELALHDSSYIQIEWTTPHITTAWPLVSIPQLGPTDEPGLIPYVLPEGMPTSLDSHPPPRGAPDPGQAHRPDLWAYLESVRDSDRRASEARSSLGLAKAAMSRVIRQRGGAASCATARMLAACLATCRASRLQAARHAIVGTGQPLLCPNTRSTGGNRVYPVRNGLVLGSVFRDRRGGGGGRPCLAYAVAPNTSDRKQPPRVGEDFRPGGRTHVAARLSDVERCVFGSRLSLTTPPDGMDKDRFQMLAWMMWWRPELGHRARRPEANHPWHMTPGSILYIYSMILHHLVGARKEDYPRLPECLKGERDAVYSRGDWYMTLVREGKCHMCRRPLMDDLRANFSELLDGDGCIDVVVIRDRRSVEEPELTNLLRSHEICA
ncbi:hypothetical protein F4820DRAFT_353699 [Hypoxylon rubiginosum]|uniref:Uncharacterized protein n=1 Tax=Hypoxylon rubiginosum TaxID=110542 RepID=A0ACB9YWZ7_9PEZI|nr:hypothetical protein F4820DRAFT_353699 [Hypoxylon rubiginosum]